MMKPQLKPYTDQRGVFGIRNQDPRKSTLLNIVRRAIDLDLLFWKQKAFFKFEVDAISLSRPLPFDPAWMEADDLEAKEDFLVQRRAPVTLFCAPALVRCGTPEADSFDKRVVICEATEGEELVVLVVVHPLCIVRVLRSCGR
jgi:hypothetical protein